MLAYLQSITYNDYDYIVEIADALSHPKGICHLETRLVDLVLRGKYPKDFPREKLQEQWAYFYQIKKRLDEKMGGSLYDGIPEERFWVL